MKIQPMLFTKILEFKNDLYLQELAFPCAIEGWVQLLHQHHQSLV